MTKSGPDITVAQLDGFRHIPSNSRLIGNDRVPSTGAAVFLDRDGVIVEDVHYLTEVNQINILPGVARAIRSLQDKYYVIVATNQSAIAREMLDETGLMDIHQNLAHSLGAQGALVDAFYYCPHLPNAQAKTYRSSCDCRKPLPGMLLNASRDWDIPLKQSFMVGDSVRDIEAGRSAGVHSILLSSAPEAACHTAVDMVDAARIILITGCLPSETRGDNR